MKKRTVILGIVAIFLLAFGVYWVLTGHNALVAHPKGIIAGEILALIKTNIFLMLVIIIPTLVWLLVVAWKYRAQNKEATYEPEQSQSGLNVLLQWGLPSIIVAIMAVITWHETHKLDPFKPIDHAAKPLTIQVVAIDWKWLFIYPEQGIATLNFVQFPEKRPIEFALVADNSPMNSFWIPELSGQIYAMTGMITRLHVMANGSGVYRGRAAEINGKGYAGMTFTAKSTTEADFDDWVQYVKQSPLALTDPVYEILRKRSEENEVKLYSTVVENLFDTIVMKPMHPHKAS